MAEPIQEDLQFDISGALQGIGQIDDALTQVVSSFQVGLASALETLTSAGQDVQPLAESLDVAGLGPAIDTALADAASTPIPIEGDTAGLDAAVSDALDEPRPPIEVEGDTDALVEAIDTATAVSATVPVDADTSQAEAGIDALSVASVDLAVTADTDQAQIAVEQVGLGAAVDIPVTADTAGAQTEIEDIGSGVSVTVPVEADTAGLESDIDAAVGPQTVALEGDAVGITEAIDAATAGTTVPVDADTTQAQAALDAIEAAPLEIPVVVETGDAQDQVDELGQSASEASSGVESLTGGVEVLSVGAGIATGHTGELATGIASIGQKSAGAVAGVVALSGFIAEVTSLASDAEAQNRRFEATFGDLADSVRAIDVGGLTIDLAELGIRSGTTNADLEATASRIGALGKSSGASDEAIVSTTQNLLALGATVAVNNPRLGDAAEVTDRLGAALARGGRALVPYNISLTSSQIIEEALAETHKESAAQLTQFEKAQAGATLAVQQFGGALGTQFASGASNAQVQLRALKVELEETLAGIGGPLLAPLTQSLKDLLPVAQSVGEVLGAVAGAVLPAFSALAPVLGAVAVPLNAVADILEEIPQPAIDVALALGVAAAASAKLAQAAILLRAAGFIGLGDALATVAARLGLYTLASGTATAATEAQTIAFTAEGFAAQKAAASTATAAAGTGALAAGLATAGAALGGIAIGLGNAKLQERASDFSLLGKAAFATGVSLFSVAPGMSAVSGVLGNFIPRVKEATVDLSGLSEKLEAVGTSRTAGLGDLSVEVDDLAKHFNSGSDQAKAFNASLIDLAQSGKVDTSRVVGLLTIELEKQGKSASEIGALFRPYFDALRVTSALNKIAQQDVSAAGITAKAASGGWLQLGKAIAAHNPAAEDAAAVAEQLGISEADATTVIKDQLDAIAEQNDQRIAATKAARELRGELESGKITSAQAEIGFLNLGVSVDGTKDILTEAAAAAKENAKALQEHRDAQVLTTDAARNLRLELATGNITAAQAETGFRKLGVSVDATKEVIDETTKAVQELVTQGLAGLPSSSDAINDWQQGASDAFKQLADDATNETGSIKDDLKALNLAADPAVAVNNIIAQFEAVQAFSDNLLALVGEFPNAVRALLSDPNKSAAKALANALVDDRETAAAFDLAVAVADAKTDELNARLKGPIAHKIGEGATVVGKAIFGPPAGIGAADEKPALEKILAAIAGMETPIQSATRRLAEGGAAAFNPDLAGAARVALGSVAQTIDASPQVADATRRLAEGGAAAFNPDLVTPTQAVLGNVAIAIDASAAVRDATRRLAEGGAAAFNPDLATSAQRAITDARTTVDADGSISSATGTKGTAAAGAFGKNIDLSAKTAAQLTAAGLTISDEVLVISSAGVLGVETGNAFATGLANSLTSTTNTDKVRIAAEDLAAEIPGPIRQLLGIASPSKVGADIGDQFVAGIVQGLQQLDPLHRATAAVALALIPDLTPALKQVPQLAPAIVASSAVPAASVRGAVGPSPADAIPGKNVRVDVTLNKTDPNPKLLADEIAWTIG